MKIKETVHRFLLLPHHVLIVLLLEFLNSFRSYGLRFVLYNYITNEFSISDTSAGALLGIKSFVDIGFGLAGSILVDMVGVRCVALSALSVGMVGRTLMAFGRSKEILYVVLFFLSPCGDALLSLGLYRVALKKLSTPLTRPLAFGVQYAVTNMAGVCVALVVDSMRKRAGDVHIDSVFGQKTGYLMDVLGGVYTPVRQFVVVTWIVLLITFVIAYFFLEDWTVVDPDDLDEEYRSVIQTPRSPPRKKRKVINKRNSDISDSDDSQVSSSEDSDCRPRPQADLPEDLIDAEPMVHRQILQRWFHHGSSYQYQPVPHTQQHQHQTTHNKEEDHGERHKLNVITHDHDKAASFLPHYKLHRTQYTEMNQQKDVESSSCDWTYPCTSILHIIKQFLVIMQLRNTWKVLVFSFASMTVAVQWTASEISLPPFLERRFGESVPIYTIQSIHMLGCLILPPFAQAFTSSLEDFRVILPGLWVMAASPIFVALSPNVFGACVWQIAMTAGQVLWSPRQDSWTASLAPTGMEGLFFAVGSSRALLAPLADVVMGAMNEKYNTNCLDCRDQYGHFCSHLIESIDEEGESLLQCLSVQDSCNIFLDSKEQACPTTCVECPSWEGPNPSMFWFVLVTVSMTCPIITWFFLPFLRGHHRNDKFYGILSISLSRVLGVCGIPDEQSQHVEEDDDAAYESECRSSTIEQRLTADKV